MDRTTRNDITEKTNIFLVLAYSCNLIKRISYFFCRDWKGKTFFSDVTISQVNVPNQF